MSQADEQISGSGGTMTRLTGRALARPVDLTLLEQLRRSESVGPWVPAGGPPFFSPGDTVLWRYGKSADPVRVVRDDDCGLVAWLPTASETLAFAPVGGGDLRDMPLEERFAVDRHPVLRNWWGPGILRIAPTGKPWSLWYFWDEDGSFEGHYVNLELPHQRCGDETSTRDLVLDLWLEPTGDLWLKDADELDAAADAAAYLTDGQAQAAEIRAVAEQARAELIETRSWPLDEDWESWTCPAGWDQPLPLPDTPLVLEARHAQRRTVSS